MAKILVVDDNSQNRYLLEVLLRGNGHTVITANNGAEGLAAARADAPDLVVSDILMPVMDGFSFCREWKRDERLQGIPFIVYTATYTEAKDEELALRLGADSFVVKPMEPDILLKIIGDTLDASRERKKPVPSGPAHGEGGIFKEYSDALFRKLEKKMRELKIANRALEGTIAERMAAETALRESEAKYRIVSDNTYDWEYWIDPAGRFIYTSPSCLRITGHGRGELLGAFDLATRMVHPEDLPAYRAHREEEEHGRGGTDVRFRIMHKDGSEHWIAHVCCPIFDEGGCFLGTRGSNRDITEQMRLEEQLRQAQKMEAVGQLAGGIAHDYNNLLTGILGYGQLIQMKTGEDDPIRENLDQLLAAAERAAGLSQRLLAFSRKQEMKIKAVDLNGLIGNLVKLMQRVIGDDVQCKTAMTEGALWISADGGQIEQVLMNLATNSRDAMPNGGILSISTLVMEMDEVFVHHHGYGVPGRYALLTVADDGVGMDAKTRERIFEPFFSTKGAGKGTGLGLSIVYGIVSQHKGFINVYSEPGEGTVFRIYLPLAEGEAAPEMKEPCGALPGGAETILVADDDAGVRELLDGLLAELGYRVLLAVDGQQAVDLFRKNEGRVDLVILDLIMANKNGKEASNEIRTINPKAKVLFTSGYPFDLIEGRGLFEAGVEYLAKPFKPTDIARKVREILDRGEAEDKKH
jgi:two-component system cell cycle sensor histidine kinase/response regulator CckA